MPTLKELLDKYHFRPITDFPLTKQKLFFNFVPDDPELVIYTKYEEQLIEFSNDDSKELLWATRLSIVSFVILKNGILFDKFIAPLKMFRIRNEYELQAFRELAEHLSTEIADFDQFIEEREDEEYEFENVCYES